MKRLLSVILALAFVLTIVSDAYAGRYYDSRVARWTIPDPALREGDPQLQMKKYGSKLFEQSPYNYSFNNPLKYADPDGKWPLPIMPMPATSWQEFKVRFVSTMAIGAGIAAAAYAPRAVATLVGMWKQNPVAANNMANAAAEALAPPGASISPIAVVGHYPEYVKLGEELGAKVFSIPSQIWNKMSAAEQWAANVKFLDRAIGRGDQILLSNPVKNINDVSGTFRKELDYLIKKGYRLSEDGTQMIK